MSKTPRTLDLLYTAIERDYAWRITELSNFKNSVITESNQKVLQGLLRAGTALLYAHWEGFIKNAADLYYQYVSFKKHRIEELSNCFISIALRSELVELSDSKKLIKHNKIIELFFSQQSTEAHFSSTSPIVTSNLYFSVFEDVCIMIGIDINELTQIYHSKGYDRSIQLTIDDSLVNTRNKIAHGEYIPITLSEYKILYEVVVNGLLFSFKEQVMDAAYNKKYLRNKAA